jgi:hypothetical protein
VPRSFPPVEANINQVIAQTISPDCSSGVLSLIAILQQFAIRYVRDPWFAYPVTALMGPRVRRMDASKVRMS